MPSSTTRRSLFAAAFAALPLAALVLACADPRPTTPDDVAASLGAPLNAANETAQAKPNPAYSRTPITFEGWAKLTNKAGFNIVIANEDKPSATHWEVFTWPETGFLTAYIPGRQPDHVRSSTPVVDGKWHYVAFVLEERRARLFVDGAVAADTPVDPPARPGTPGGLAFGTLVTGDIACSGSIANVRLSNVARDIRGLPTGPLTVDADTIGLWDFSRKEGGRFRDLSPLKNDAVLRTAVDKGIWPNVILGRMSADFQPMPPAPDVAPSRALLEKAVADLALRSARAADVRDGVLRDWDTQYRYHGKREYPQATWARQADIEAQVYDRNALIWPSDGGPLGTVLRRTEALAKHLAATSAAPRIAPMVRDLAAVKAAAEREKPSVGSDRYRALYLAACLVRRGIAFSNPLLNFDKVLCVARGSFEGSARSNPNTGDDQGGHFATQFFGFNTIPGGGLYVVQAPAARTPNRGATVMERVPGAPARMPSGSFAWGTPRIVNVVANSVVANGRLKGQKLDHGAFITPDLSFDGKRIAFAWTANSEHKWVYSRTTCWHVFTVNADGSNLEQLTDGAVDDFDPCWLPNGRLAFVSERRGGYIRCFGNVPVRNYTLFSMKDDGTDIRPLSYYETSEWNPSVANDGRLLYTRWDYTDRENCLGTRIWTSGPDGTDPRAPHGNYPLPLTTLDGNKPWKVVDGNPIRDSRTGAPYVEMGIRAIPNSPKFVFTASPHHGQVFGSLCILDLSVPDDGHMSQVRRITPEEVFPESEAPPRQHYKYGQPWPLSEDFFLCNTWENLYLLDRYGNRELICELDLLPCKQDERLRIMSPIPLRARAVPAVLPDRVASGKGPVTSETLRVETGKAATVAVFNVYDSDLPMPQGVRIKWLRVTQDILKENHWMGLPMIGYERENTPRIPLGIVPVEDDGSVYFEAPIAKELIFQTLDENYMAVQSMRSTAFVHPGEQLRCLGCHENNRATPKYPRMPAALRRAASKLQPELGTIQPIGYYRQIEPIVEARCVPCHVQQKRGPTDMSYEALRDQTFWFSGAMSGDMNGPYSGIHGGSRTIPGRFGARACRLGRALLDETHRTAVTAEDRHTIALWIDCNSPRLTAYQNEEAQLRGELVWPVLDVDPRNPLGTEGTQPALERSFWHENQQGPYPCLISEHEHDRVAILDAAGKIVWEYGVPHPQDVWMLPNGNILTCYYQGVREVTRDKKVVWEYTTQKPNEIPNCQPLPDGNVLIGIVGECRLVEVDRQGKTVHEVQLSTTVKEPHAQFRMCRKTPEGTYLVPFTAEGAIREYDRDGKVVREFPNQPSPVCALRLSDGRTLISGGSTITEYDREGGVIWQVSPEWLPDVNVATLAGVQRLPNGNTIVCNWNTKEGGGKDGAHIMEITPDKRIVWQVTGTHIGQVAQCQLLTPDYRPVAEAIVR